jgi:hypothetical protein
MKQKPELVTRYGEEVWSNEVMDMLRRSECLCFNCKDLPTCPIATLLFSVCRENNLAVMVTRCPKFNLQEENLK